jgi:hypothetical protein
MHDKSEQREKKLQSEHAADEIRADELIKITQGEAGRNEERLQDIPVSDRKYWRRREKEQSALPKGIKWGITGLVILFIGGFVVSFYVARKNVAASLSGRIATLQAGVNDLQNLDPQSAEQQFASLNASSSPSDFLGTIMSLFENSSGAVKAFTDLSNQLTLLSQDVASAENDAFTFASGGGSTFVADLNNIKVSLAAIDADTSQLSGAANSFGNSSAINGQSYIALKTQVEGAENFLDALVPWLSATSTTHHLLVLLQNPSEMRPGGGFLGSYADVSINGGNITDVSVHDIADVDSAFTQKIVPPVPLQLEETAWRPADGNWFFDFPTSASETIGLFQQSGLYADTSTTFDGAIAITPQVMSDLLSATGPITVAGQTSKASTTFTSGNLVVQIQKIVQAGQAGSSGGDPTYPKKILGELTQAIFQNLASSTYEQKTQMLGMALNWIANKDVMVYFKDPDLETFIQANGAAGDEYKLPENFNGDYLAIVNADINSDKSELYVWQKVSFDTEINSDGTATEHLIIDRTHDGNQSPYWWYQTTNQDYMQIFVPQGTSLDNESGGIAKSVPAPINYAAKGYSTDSLLFAIQSSTQMSFAYPKISSHGEDGKEVFGVWSRTYAGDTSEISFDYSHPLYGAPAPGEQYQFIFEKQAGAEGDYSFNINAPLGYVFAENNLASFTYESTSTPGRLVIDLTLQKL